MYWVSQKKLPHKSEEKKHKTSRTEFGANSVVKKIVETKFHQTSFFRIVAVVWPLRTGRYFFRNLKAEVPSVSNHQNILTQ